MSYITLTVDKDKIVEMIFDQPGVSVNTMGSEYVDALIAAVDELERMKGDITGVYLRSAKSTFFGGGDLKLLLDIPPNASAADKAEKYNGILDAKKSLRKLETLGVPVVAGINGSALGGGYEIALACHRRIAIDDASIRIGLPEAQLGLMPGSGGLVRMVRLLGIEAAITFISTGKQLGVEKALDKGMVDEVVGSEEAMHARAKQWILDNVDSRQPWDCEGYQIPGGSPDMLTQSKQLQGLIYFGPVNVLANTWGNHPAQKAIFACACDVARVDFDAAERIEARYFVSLLYSSVSKNMISTFFFQLNDLKEGKCRPKHTPHSTVSRVGIIGAGQMGTGVAMLAAKQGVHVNLMSSSIASAERGRERCHAVAEKAFRGDQVKVAEAVSKIDVISDYKDLVACDLVIEAVSEDLAVKHDVLNKIFAAVGPETVVASNTSSMRIEQVASLCQRKENVVGMHFFSPAEKMPLVEIIRSKYTDDRSASIAFDLALQLGKTPILVNDANDFFANRVISAFIAQAAEMVIEGVNPAIIENAAKQSGCPVGPLSAMDEIGLDTAYKTALQKKKFAEQCGDRWEDNAPTQLVRLMVEHFQRQGKNDGKGFYEYPETGAKFLWPGLKQHFSPEGFKCIPFQDVKDRLVISQVLEAFRALETGVIQSTADGNIGSIMGVGFPAHTGGVFRFVDDYGARKLAERCEYLSKQYGDDFSIPALLAKKATLVDECV